MIVEQSVTERAELCSALGARLYDIRRILGLSQLNLGELCGVTRPRMIQIEHGSVRLSPCQMNALLLVCYANRAAFDYLLRANVPELKYFSYLQNREEGLLPDFSFSLPRGLREIAIDRLAPVSGKLLPIPAAEKKRLCEALTARLSSIRRVLRVSQDRFSAQCGFSRVRLIRLEKGECLLSYTQACAVLFVSLFNAQSREYLIREQILSAPFLCAIERAEHPEGLPILNFSAHPELFPDYAAQNE